VVRTGSGEGLTLQRCARVSADSSFASATNDADPGARQLMFPGVGHMLNLEHPEAFNRAVIDFLAEPPGDGEPAGDGMNGAAR
jgi:hypothetical protein